MPGVTGTSQIDAAVEKFLAESRYQRQERPGVMRSSVKVERLPKNAGTLVNIPKFGQVTTYALTEGVDMTQAQQITDTNMQITPAEFGAQVVLTDMMLDMVRDDFFNVAGRILADSYERRLDQTLSDDLDNFSVALGSAGAALTIGLHMAAEAAISYDAPADGSAGRGDEPAPEPFYAVYTPAQLHSLRKTLDLPIQVSSGTPDNAQAQHIRGTFRGEFKVAGLSATIKSSINLSKDTSDDAKGGVFSKEAIILVEHGDRASVEKERDASLRGWELNYVGRWGRGEYEDGWGREMLFDSSKPTS